MLASDVITYARAATDHDSDTQITDPQLVTLLNPIWQRLYRKIAQRVPTLFTKVVTFTLAAGNTQDVTGAPVSLTDFDRVRRIRRQISSSNPVAYVPVGTANPIDPENPPFGQDYGFLERGTILEFYPASGIPGLTFELAYLTSAVALTVVSSPLTGAVAGLDEVLGEELAAKIRPRFDEAAAGHIAAARYALDYILTDLQSRYGIHPEGWRETQNP